jgi:F-type H+-transporting ATPase subunit epsilon
MPEPKNIALTVITPERQVLEEPADAVVIPAHDGELGVLQDRAALMCELGIGQLRFTRAGQTRRLFIDGGFAQVFDNHVTVLTSQALPAEMVTSEVIAAAEKDAQALSGHDPASRQAQDRARRRLSVLRGLSTHR